MPPSLPLELKTLIVAEVFSSEPCGRTLSSLCLAWPEANHFIRQRRFKAVEISSEDALTIFLDTTDGAPEIFTAIRSMIIAYMAFEDIGHGALSHLISNAVNLEALELRRFKFKMDRDYAHVLHTCAHLTKLSLTHTDVDRVSDLFHILSSIPRLTNLILRWPRILELRGVIFPKTGPNIPGRRRYLSTFEIPTFETPKPIAQISSLWLDVGQTELPLLDLISSPETPFPGLREIIYSDLGVRGYGPHRLPGLLERYHSSLRVLDLRSELLLDLATLTLPPLLEHFKFAVYHYTLLEPFCRVLLSWGKKSLTKITLRLDLTDHSNILRMELPFDVGRLDEVLAGLNLERLNVEIVSKTERFDGLVEKRVDEYFPRCARLDFEGRLVWGVHWVSPY